jgi:hypothetical protein
MSETGDKDLKHLQNELLVDMKFSHQWNDIKVMATGISQSSAVPYMRDHVTHPVS